MKKIYDKVDEKEKSDSLKNTLDSMTQIHQNTIDDLEKIRKFLRN